MDGAPVTDPPDEPVNLAESMDAVLRALKGPSRSSLDGVFGRWDDVVGPALAAHVRPVRLEAGVLTVEVGDPAWATQLSFLMDELRARLAAETGVIVERIEVRVGSSRRS
jgi:hypothetical protein